jgi:hypothetical protein
MKICKLLPKNFPQMDMYEQLDAMIDAYEISIRLTGDTSYKDNIKQLEFVKTEFKKTNSKPVNIFQLMGNEFTENDFHRMKLNV